MTPKDREDREELLDRLDLLFDAGVDWAMDDEGYPHGGQLPARSKAAAVEALIPFIEQLVVEARNEGIRTALAAVKNTFDKEWSDTANELKCGCGRFLHQTVYLARCAVSGLLPKEDQP